MLTPVRVRGKNKRNQSRKLRRQALEQGTPIRPRGRPLKLVASSTPEPTTSPQHSHISKTSRPPKPRRKQMKEGPLPEPETTMPLSRLESLPVELLESIFLYSPNVHLPLASPYLARALSSEHLYTRLTLLAFSDFAQIPEEAGSHPDLTSASLQTALLSRRWFNSELMRRCAVIFAKEILETERENSTWEITNDETTEFDLKTKGGPKDPSWLFQLRRDTLCKRIDVFQNAVGTFVIVRKGNLARICTFPLCYKIAWKAQCEHVLIPEKLLHGPWTEEKLDFLHTLCEAGAMVDWINTSAGEIAEQGLNDAIIEGNLRAVKLLTQYSTGVSTGIDGKMIGVKIDTRHVRLAVLEAGCDLNMIQALVQPSKGTVDLDDEQIVAWAVRDKSHGGMKGAWLLNRLRLEHDSSFGATFQRHR